MIEHHDPRVPAARDCVVRHILDRRAQEHGDRVYATFLDGTPDWTFADLRRNVIETANGLRECGVRQGDHVLAWLPNGTEALRVLLAINYLGATFVPINTAYKGRLLEHAIRLSDAELIAAHAALVPLLADIDTAQLRRLVVVSGEPPAQLGALDVLPGSVLATGNFEPPPLDRDIAPWDIQCILYTSGTTGASKAVLCPYTQVHATCVNTYPFMGEDDRIVVYLPIFHIGGFSGVGWALVVGGSIAVFERYDTTTYWRDVRRTRSTFSIIMGAVATFLLKQPPSEDEKNTTLRYGLMAPITTEARMLAQRVGFHCFTTFNMTETSTPVRTPLDPPTSNNCGRPRPGVEARVVDENDCEVPIGTIGELIIRTDTPWTMNAGYYKDPEATNAAWRNGWFHTGDAFRIDELGDFYYVDRIKDSIRRRGENISSAEVEFEVNAHPGVKESAAIAVKSEFSEDEVMAVVVPAEGQSVDPAELINFLIPRMAYYMVPRYVRVIDEFPRTPTQRVQKHILRTQGITPDTWDRVAAGISIKKERL
jgi:crotonobetaine/carnitine-CoA ligase